MSVYIMTLGELAKKRGEPVGEFVKKVQELGFSAGSHAKKLTQQDLDLLISLLDNKNKTTPVPKDQESRKVLKNANVLFLTREDGKKEVLVVDVSRNNSGELMVEVISKTVQNSIGEGLLEFRKQLGMKLGVN